MKIRVLVHVLLVCSSILGCPAPCRADTNEARGWMGLVSVGLAFGVAGYDIVSAPASAGRYNEGRLALVPWLDARQQSLGIRVTVPLGRRMRPTARRAGSDVPPVGTTAKRAKSPLVAFALSTGATLLPVASIAIGDKGAYLALAGLTFGPSAGHWYAGQGRRAWTTTGIRIGLFAVTAAAWGHGFEYGN